jgi:hypothetical protein
MNTKNFFEKFFGVFINPQTYLNLIYLFLAFPLGLIYFILLVTGLSLGIPLIIIWVGLFILAGVFALSWILTAFERLMAISLLRVDIPPMTPPQQEGLSFLEKIKNYFSNPVTWKGMFFLAFKLPIGVITFTISVTLIALSVGLLAAPFVYPYAPINIGFWDIDTLAESVLVFLAGGIVAPVSLHILNGAADLCGHFAALMLGHTTPNKKDASSAESQNQISQNHSAESQLPPAPSKAESTESAVLEETGQPPVPQTD